MIGLKITCLFDYYSLSNILNIPINKLVQNNSIFKSWYIYNVQIIIHFNLHFKSKTKCNVNFFQQMIRLKIALFINPG